jgi:fatty acid desaturase
VVDDRQVAQWRRDLRSSIRALPVVLALFAVVVLGLYGLSFWIAIPIWLTIVLLGAAAFAIVGDGINILVLTLRLRRARRGAP